MHKINRRNFLKIAGAGAAAMALPRWMGAAETTAKRPNVVFILADDLGWRDTSLYGSKFCETPNIERLATRGMMFMNAYAANPLCSPTRASIMTGLYPARIGITAPVCHVPEEHLQETLQEKAGPAQKALIAQSATRLKQDYFTLAEALKEAGYATGHFGKWHLGPEPYDPLHQGFDVDVPHHSGPGPAGSYIAPWKFPPKLNFTGEPGEHLEDRMSREAIKFIRQHKDQPFFLNYWCFSVHSPWDAKKELIEKYRAKADPKSPQRHPIYGAMVQSMDDAVGSLMRTLDELKLSDNTIVVFFSDNGGVHWAPERGQAKEDFGDTPITSNAPLRGGKAMIYEGGTREPCVVVWPGVVKPGSKSDALIQSIDFHPTILAMLGLKPKENLKFDGMSIVPALRGEPLGRDTIFCHFPHNVKVNGNLPATYVRKGDWKLIRIYCDNDDQTNRFELYNLKDDESETKNLADRMPEKVKELDALIERHVKEIGAVVPKPNPAYRRGAQDEAAGWKAGGTCSLAAKDGVLRVTSTGGDPNIVTNQTPDCSGPLLFKVRMKCATKGAGEVRWTDAEVKTFGRIAYVSFPIQHDGQWHEYEAQMTVKGKLASLRLDPGAAEGEIEIAWIRLVKPDGTALKEWKF